MLFPAPSTRGLLLINLLLKGADDYKALMIAIKLIR